MEEYYLYNATNILLLGYIDPGMGSMLLQFIITAIIGVFLFFRRLIGRIVIQVRNKLFGSKRP